MIENKFKKKCYLFSGDVGDKEFCVKCVNETVKIFGKIDILINNVGEQHTKENISEISQDQLIRTFKTNIFSFFYLTQAALPSLLKTKGVILNTASVTAFKGNEVLVDYSSSKGAIISFTRSLAVNLAEKGIRVNAIAPGPVWTPLISASFDKKHVENFGKNVLLKRPAQPCEIAGVYTFLASKESSYITGQVIHPNGGTPL